MSYTLIDSVEDELYRAKEVVVFTDLEMQLAKILVRTSQYVLMNEIAR